MLNATSKTGRLDIAEILLKVAFNTKINQSIMAVSVNLLVEETRVPRENHRPVASH